LRTPASNMLLIWFKRAVSSLDPFLLIVSLLLTAIGLLSINSASSDRVVTQALYFAISFILMWGVSRLSLQNLMRLAMPIYIVSMALLMLVFAFGLEVNGARRWLSLGFIRIQPSEIMKIAAPLMLAFYFNKVGSDLRPIHFATAFFLLALPFAFIFKQPDLGTALLIGSSGLFVIFLAGLSWRFIAVTLFSMAVSVPFLWTTLHDYQKRRILTLLDPDSDPLGAGYHIIQSTIAIGSGGMLGKGYMQGTQAQLEFIPERHTDFIFAVFAEEWGFVGCMVLLVLYAAMILRGISISASSSTVFARLLAGAITLSFFVYAFVNLGMVSGILPVVGVPLPFISYGGTALVVLFVNIGILMSISTHWMLVKR